jgi:hypothetical protein
MKNAPLRAVVSVLIGIAPFVVLHFAARLVYLVDPSVRGPYRIVSTRVGLTYKSATGEPKSLLNYPLHDIPIFAYTHGMALLAFVLIAVVAIIAISAWPKLKPANRR